MRKLLLFLSLLGAAPLSAQVVISQIYTGDVEYAYSFVELYNPTSSPVSLNNWTLQFASRTGTSWQKTDLSGSIHPGGFYLVQEALNTGTVGTAPLPAPDATGTVSLSSTGKIALLNTSAVISSGTACPSGAPVIDVVGFGSGTNCFGGAGPTPTPTFQDGELRRNLGCTNTGNNATDFVTTAPMPRNSASTRLTLCPATVPTVAINQIQGPGNTSPLVGLTVTTTGIVTARKSNGFFMQTPDSQGDGNPDTSEGVFVFTGLAPSSTASIGNLVQLTATVAEFVPDQTTQPTTELSGIISLSQVSTGNPLPAPIQIASLSPSGGRFQLEKYEGMRVSVHALNVVAPTFGSIDEPSATATSTGIFFGVLPGTARPFREPGIEAGDGVPNPPCCVPVFDSNPERLRINTLALSGGTALDVTTGATVNNILGVLEFFSNTATIDTDPSHPAVAGGNITATPVPAASANEITVGAFNMNRFYDTTPGPGTSEATLTPQAFANRLNKASLIIRNILRTPDILGVEEVENLATLQAIAAKIDADSAPGTAPQYQSFLLVGNDISNINVGYLVKKGITVNSVTQVGATIQFTNPDTGTMSFLNDRPPLVLQVSIQRHDGKFSLPVTIIDVHQRSISGIDFSNFTRAKRQAQSELLAGVIQQYQSQGQNVIVSGDFNAYQFNDGYFDVIGTVTGNPTPASHVLLASPALVTPPLTDLANSVPPAQRYSYVFNGSAQVLDHILASATLLPRFTRMAFGRTDADFPEVYRSDPNRPERLSDHDPALAYFTLANVEVTGQFAISGSALGFDHTSQTFTGTITITNHGAFSIQAPLELILSGLTPGVTLVNQSGLTPSGSPYLTIPGASIAPGASVTLNVQFQNHNSVPINYRPTIVSGAF